MIINLDNQTDLSGFYVVYEGSTNLEKPGNYGISHLMEHLVCKSIDHLQDVYDENGIVWNAYTSGNEIVFHMKGLDENVNKYKGEFLKLLTDFNVTKKEFENERNIVLEEYMDVFNDQATAHYLNLDRKIYDNYNPIGRKSDLENLKFMDCLNFFEEQYMNPTKIINVSKHNKFNENVKFAKREINKEYKISENNGSVDLELDSKFGNKSSLIMKSPIITEDFNQVQFINALLSSGLNSPLYKEVREKKGLCYYISCSTNRMNNVGDIDICTLTSSDNVEEIVNTIGDIFENIDQHMTKERFNVVKNSLKISLAKGDINRHSNVSRWINPKEWDVSQIIDTITLEDCRRVFDKYYNLDKFYISDDKNEFK
ncbi:MAG: putative zinc protease [uncultured marine phage]|uniref:Putative zinc protease n=1 Tax=uncultured marine phage TaxID=707152 RepID=A0A8D9CCE3_9VIRU|nr:MAG: putative zinc protease [uncultured marine phage]